MGKNVSFLEYNFFHFTHQNSSHVAASVLLLFQSETTLYYCWIYFVLFWFCGFPVTQSVLILGLSVWWWWGGESLFA